MENKNGFTLVEILAVIIVLGLVMAVSVPSSITIGNKIKDKLLSDKLALAEKSAVLWGQDNRSCFSGSGCLEYPETMDSVCSLSGDLKTCYITLEMLAEDEYYDYDNESKIENPKDSEKCLNNYIINLTYNKKNKSFKTTMDLDNQDSSC
ncbi:MAG: type II secretion system protein [Bacilli bacterium]|nr:type II secretion system protein [Bacilli bacterium]